MTSATKGCQFRTVACYRHQGTEVCCYLFVNVCVFVLTYVFVLTCVFVQTYVFVLTYVFALTCVLVLVH